GPHRLLHRARGIPDLLRSHHRRRGLQLSRDVRRRSHRLLAARARRGPRDPGAGAALGHHRHRRAPRAADPGGRLTMSLLETQKLTKYFGDTHAVDHVDFRVDEGEVLALIGSNGAGKTTLVNLISGLIPSDSGTMRFQDRDITGASIHGKIAAGI